jgi:hypothetical protein
LRMDELGRHGGAGALHEKVPEFAARWIPASHQYAGECVGIAPINTHAGSDLSMVTAISLIFLMA